MITALVPQAHGDFRTVKVSYSGASFMLGEALVEVPRLVASGGAVLMAAALFAFLRLTDVGKALRALAEEPEGAALVGINVSRIRAASFGLGSACVAVAGALITPFFYVAPDVAESFNIMAFVVVVLAAWGISWAPSRVASSWGLAESLGAAFPPRLAQAARGLRDLHSRAALRPQGLFGGSRER